MDSIFSKVKDLYGVTVDSSEKVTKGFLSDNLILKCGDKKYFLKKYRFDNDKRIREVHAVKKYFSEKGIPIVMPILTKAGDTFFEHEGSFYTLFPFINGKHMSGDKMPEASIISLAHMLGRIHMAGKDSQLKMDDFFKPWNSEKSLEKIETLLNKISEIPAGQRTDFDKQAEKLLLLKKKLIEEQAETYEQVGLKSDYLTHGDYMAQNVFFDDNGQVSHVFDLEKTEYAPRTFELFRSAVTSLFNTDPVGDEHLRRFMLYINAYNEVCPISKEELLAGLRLYYMRVIHGQWVEGEHYLKGSTRTDELLRNDSFRLSFFVNNMEKIKDALG